MGRTERDALFFSWDDGVEEFFEAAAPLTVPFFKGKGGLPLSFSLLFFSSFDMKTCLGYGIFSTGRAVLTTGSSGRARRDRRTDGTMLEAFDTMCYDN